MRYKRPFAETNFHLWRLVFIYKQTLLKMNVEVLIIISQKISTSLKSTLPPHVGEMAESLCLKLSAIFTSKLEFLSY